MNPMLWRAALIVLLLGAAAPSFAADPAAAQARRQVEQPLNNAPVWHEVRGGEVHYTSTRGVETGVLMQPGGETWRQLRNGPVTLYGGIFLCVVLVLIVLFYKLRGPISLTAPKTGRVIERFNGLERATHWTLAITFCILALSGLILTFGKHLLLPLFGYSLFAWVAQASKLIHNLVGPLFIVANFVFFFLLVKDNLFRAEDGPWFRKNGGMFSGEHVPSFRFNGGEKVWFWLGVFLLGLAVSVSGLILNFPNFEQGRWVMQTAHIVHLAGSLLVVGLACGHTYLGTLGVPGAYEAMRYGRVDETWAKEHHEYWYDEVKHLAQAPQVQASGAAAPGGAIVQSGHAAGG